MKLRLKELEIESDLEGAIRVEGLRLVQKLNGQPRLTVKFLMEEHTAAELVRRASDIPVTVREHAFTGGRVVFSGKAEELWTATEKGLTCLWLDAYPSVYQGMGADRKEQELFKRLHDLYGRGGEGAFRLRAGAYPG